MRKIIISKNQKKNKLGEYMVHIAERSLNEVDVRYGSDA